MSILSICSDPDVLSVVRIVRIALVIIRIAGPIALMVSLMLSYLGAVKDNDSDAVIKVTKSIVPKSIAAILLFLIPTFVNVIANIVDHDNETYLSCLKYATSRNIDGARVLKAEQAIDQAKVSLRESDYNKAVSLINKISDAKTRDELLAELADVKLYIEVMREIVALKDDFSKEKYQALVDKIEKVQDIVIREKLLAALKEAIGNLGTLDMYDINPNSSKYKNTKPLKEITIKQLLEQNGSSVEKLNNEMRNAVDMFGAGTRQAPIAAAMVLHETLARYGYHLYYRWGGKHSKVGVNSEWGKNIGSTGLCTSVPHPDPGYCLANFKYSGLDCKGFVNWALAQGFQSASSASRAASGQAKIDITGKTTAVCGVGDTLVSDVHIVIVAKLDDKNKRYIILEDTGTVGMRISTIPYGTNVYKCRKVSYKN